ncbi:hypothetical protein ACJDT4_16640 [Clostridium neuense]|uniref:Uncharacterized protein n=1 Tax=Clostridium neuense TaxID=1728934 RepID=A0ABW8THR5_9CLOT
MNSIIYMSNKKHYVVESTPEQIIQSSMDNGFMKVLPIGWDMPVHININQICSIEIMEENKGLHITEV